MLLASVRDTVRLGRAVGSCLQSGDLVLLSGPLGVGKTLLAAALVRSRGVRAPVTSPTFTLVTEYPGHGALMLHADLYRLLDAPGSLERELARLGLREARQEGAILVVEWGDSVSDLLGGNPAFDLRLAFAGSTARSVEIKGERAAELALRSRGGG